MITLHEFRLLRHEMEALLARAGDGTLTPNEQAQGICGCLDDIIELNYHLDSSALVLWVEDKAKAWPGTSGNPLFPVEGDHKVFTHSCRTRTAWEGDNGKRRVSLLKWLINRVEIACMNL